MDTLFLGEKVSNEIEAYLLGFIYADGYITNKIKNKHYILGLTLSEKDKELLDKIKDIFNNCLNKNYNLKYNKKTKSYKLSIGNINLINNLKKLGICEQKTYENNDFVFLNIPDNLKIHFIRGFFDGDGSICYTKQKQYVISIVSLNHNLLNTICSFLNENFKLNIKTHSENKKYCRISYGGTRNTRKFLQLIYNNSVIYLKRKYDKFKSIPEDKKKYKYKGITYYKKNKKWVTHIYINNTRKYLGIFETEYEAFQAYNKEAIELNKPTQEWKGETIL